MSSLSDIYIKTDVLEMLLKTAKAKNMKGIGITISISDETNQYDQNVSGYVSQTKEEREAKKNRFYVGNGKVFWTDGPIVKAEKKAVMPEQETPTTDTDELPF